MKNNFKDDITGVRRLRPALYKNYSIDLGTAKDNEEFTQSGNYLYVPYSTGKVFIRLNEISNDPIELHSFRKITGSFYRFFLSWSAQPDLRINFTTAINQSESYNDFQIIDTLPNRSLDQVQDSFEERAFWGNGSAAAVAAKYSIVELWNSSSDYYATVDKIIVKSNITTITDVYLGFLSTTPPKGSGGLNCNIFCLKYSAPRACTISFNNLSSQPSTAHGLVDLMSNGYNTNPFEYDFSKNPIILLPNHALEVWTSIMNANLKVIFSWVERPL